MEGGLALLHSLREGFLHRSAEEITMLGGRGDEMVELECPECGTLVKTRATEAEKGKVRCPRGHEFAVMGMLGGVEETRPAGRR
jgi:hypothetical protein